MTQKPPRDDFREDLKHNHSRMMRMLFFSIGTVFLIIGLVGVFLPVLPTTPFILVTAACYARSSPRFYHWLMNHKVFGPYLRAWRDEKRIPLRAKILAFTMITVSITICIVFIIPVPAVKILLAVIAISVMIYISRFPN